MSGILLLFSSEIEHRAAFPDGDPDGLKTGIAGVGLVDAGIGAARLIDTHDPTLVIFAGTCGAYPRSGLAIGDLVVASQVSLGSGDVARGQMRIPALLPATIPVEEHVGSRLLALEAGGRKIRLVRCSCTLGITEDDRLAEELEAYDRSEVENLELFAILRAAGSRPAAGMMGVTNMVGAGGGKQWRENYRDMMKQVGETLRYESVELTRILSANVFPKDSI